MSNPIEFEIVFSGLPKAINADPLSELLTKRLSADVVKKAHSVPVVSNSDLPDGPIAKLLGTWINHLANIPKVWEPPRHYIRIDGHKAEFSDYTVTSNGIEITLKRHPFLTMYFKRRKYSELRLRMLKLKGRLRNLK